MSNPYTELYAAAAQSDSSLKELESLLRDWTTSGPNLTFDQIVEALGQQQEQPFNTLIQIQVAVDMLLASATSEQLSQADQEVARLAELMEFSALAQYPEILSRLVDALSRVAQASNDHELICRRLLALVERINHQMAETRKPTQNLGQFYQTRKLGQGEKLDNKTGHGIRLTVLHTECLNQCLLAGRAELHAEVAAKVTDTKFDSFGRLVYDRAESYMLFYFNAGMIYVGLRSYQQALDAWHMVFALPQRHLSAIQVATYKRLVLLNLVVYGCHKKLPQLLDDVHLRTVEGQASNYHALGNICGSTKTVGNVVDKVHNMEKELVADDNFGLAQQAVMECPAHLVRRQRKVFTRQRLIQLAEAIGFADHPLAADATDLVQVSAVLAQYIQQMNDPSAVLENTDVDNMTVRFVDPKTTAPVVHNNVNRDILQNQPVDMAVEQEWVRVLKANVEQTHLLQERLELLNGHLGLTKEYVFKDQA